VIADYITIAALSSAVTLVIDEMYDAHKLKDPSKGLKLRDIGKLSHETAIIILIIVAIVSFLV